VNRFFSVLSGYIWWNQPRGTVHYDVMVTLILLFIFLGPRKIDFKDKPATLVAHPNQVIAYSDAQGGLVYEVPASRVTAQSALDQSLSDALRPVAGDVAVLRYEPLRNQRGELIAYRVWIRR